MLSTENPVEVRPGKASDLAYVYRTWLDGLRQADPSPLPNDLFFPAHREYINRVLATPGTQLQVVAPSDRSDDIIGYIVAEPASDTNPGLIQWLFLRPQYRGKHLGLIQLLLAATGASKMPLAWRTSDSKKLRNPLRSRQSRHRHALLSTVSKLNE
jgi:GNAT superfamily N-acetyltransferase